MTLQFVTLTGADDGASIDDLLSIGEDHPQAVEWGILLSYTRQGAGRYPSLHWIDNLASHLMSCDVLGAERPRFALHACGAPALADFFNGEGHAGVFARAFDRVQLNLRWNPAQVDDIIRATDLSPRQTIITQHNKTNAALFDHLLGRGVRNHAILFDGSGGRGNLPACWPKPLSADGTRYGYAGGLGPGNLADALPAIAEASQGQNFWADMESSLRTADDQFDLDVARRCLDIAQAYRPRESREARAAVTPPHV